MPGTGFLIRSGAIGLRNKAFSTGGRGSDMFPIMEALVEIPQFMVSPSSRIGRVIHRGVRESLHKEMQFHHKRRIPDHFNRFRQKKYAYAPRSERTRAIKQRRNQADLVKTSRTKRKQTSEIKIEFPRAGGTGGVLCRGTLKWPVGFRVNTAATKGVTAEVMAKEISRFTAREEQIAAEHIRDSLVEYLNTNLSRRAKIKIAPQLRRLGIGV